MNALDIEHSVGRVHGGLVLRGLTDQSLLRSEGDEGRCGETTLLVGDYNTTSDLSSLTLSAAVLLTDLNAGALIVGDAGIGRS